MPKVAVHLRTGFADVDGRLAKVVVRLRSALGSQRTHHHFRMLGHLGFDTAVRAA